MNDFTKEELVFLIDVIIYWNKINRDTDWIIDLKYKIQSMITDYCEHENKEAIRETMCCGQKLFYAAVNWSIAKCGSCGKKLNDNQ